MNWILDHLQFVIAGAAALAYWINQMRAKVQATKADAPPESKFEPAQANAEDPERTRRIQEEIRRKIAERRGVGPPATSPAPTTRPLAPPLVAPRPVARSEGGLRERLERKLSETQARETARDAARERQRQLEARARSAEGEKLSAQRRATVVNLAEREESRAVASAQLAADNLAARPGRAWLDDLRDPQSARRAIVLREVLGPPVGLR